MTPQVSYELLHDLVEQAPMNAQGHRAYAEALQVYESLILMSETPVKTPDAAG